MSDRSNSGRERGPRWLVNRAKVLGLDMALALATPGPDLYRDDACHIHNIHHAIFSVQGHDGEVYGAMQDIFDWHNLRITASANEGFFRCLAIYGAAAQAVLELSGAGETTP